VVTGANPGAGPGGRPACAAQCRRYGPLGQGEVAYWIMPIRRGQNMASRAVEALTKWAFDEVGFHRLELTHSVSNPPSCRVAIKSGFGLEGVKRGAGLHLDGWHDLHLHARVNSNQIL
jgi:[ribosomal protein S5]-alanine N-acetyltransferase